MESSEICKSDELCDSCGFRQSLIGGSGYKNVPLAPSSTKPDYALLTERYAKSAVFYSCDMVRFDVAWPMYMTEKVADFADTFTSTNKAGDFYSVNSNKIGGFRFLNVYKCGEEDSFSFGRCHIDGKTRNVENKGFVEGNPNKVLEQLKRFVSGLVELGCTFQLKRWDLAIDYPIRREAVRMLKDQRKYECVISRSFTEYLGQRNNPGRVKLYDKAAEQCIDTELTRLELTCDGTWTVQDIRKHLPRVFFTARECGGFSGTSQVLVNSLCMLMQKGEPLEPLIGGLDKRMKRRIRQALADSNTLPFDDGTIGAVLGYARDIAIA